VTDSIAEVPLARQRLTLREQLQKQRRLIARRLEATALSSGYPRSMVMRLLIQRPELLPSLVALVAGAGLRGPLSAILGFHSALRLAAVTEPDQERPAP
jgi:hypothetical protein